MRLTHEQHQRFWAKVKKTDDCWYWQGEKGADGHGRFRLEGRTPKKRITTRVLSYRIHYDDYDPDMFVDQVCGCSTCVKPTHLKLVTRQKHGRCLVDEQSKKAGGLKLNYQKAELIRKLKSKYTNKQLAQMFGISCKTVSNITTNKTWIRNKDDLYLSKMKSNKRNSSGTPCTQSRSKI